MQLLNLALSGRADDDSPVLKRNLDALGLLSPETARLVREASPAAAEFVPSAEPDPGLVVGGRTLASRRKPVTEAQRLAASVDAGASAAACVLGFGAGYHCRELCARLGRAGLVICFEPDVALLRAVLERVDHSGWLRASRFVLLTRAEDRAAIGRAIDGVEGLIALGVTIVEHPASSARLGASAAAFGRALTEVVSATRTVIATTLAHSGTTLRNLFMNADHYAAAEGIAPLAGAAAGRAAVVVSAGPSLSRNLALLGEPGVRDRVVIIAVQTVLRTMLERGIRPHFVCALDHHEISRRFYEGLTAADAAGVTLVADPKVNPAVLEAWPGALRLAHNDLLERLVGSGAPKGELKPGATVAHLCHYLARHLGADPVVLIGQDLGFTDGQYYADKAAIHQVWAGEIGAFNSVEAMEWQRIARAKRTLQRRTDVLGRAIFTDDQMASYLAQFEVDFAADAARGLRVIDATEGGVSKAHTAVMTLGEALAAYAGEPMLPLPEPARVDLAAARPAAAARLEEARSQAAAIARRSGDTVKLLRSMLGMGDARRVNEAVARVHAIRDEVTAMQPAWRLVTFLNQTGALHRIRADRAIELDAGLDAAARQRRQIERDIDNVEGFIGAAEHLETLLGRARRAVAGAEPKATRDVAEREVRVGAARGRVEALVVADPGVSGLGVARDLGEDVAHGLNALCMTVGRLLRCERIAGVTVLTGDPQRVRGLLGALAGHARVAIEPVDGEAVRARLRAVGRARLMNPSSWRGGIGGLTCYDEALEPSVLARVMERRRLDAALLVGAEWSLVDPALGDALVERWAEAPDSSGVVFTQAAPGLAPVLIDRETAKRLGDTAPSAGAMASLGGLLGYVPHAPQHDPIATRLCVHVSPALRDLGRRVVADSMPGRARVGRAASALGEAWLEAGAEQIAHVLNTASADATPRHLELELCTGRLSSGPWARWMRRSHEPIERGVMSLPTAHRILKQLAESREDAAVTLGGVGDPLMHERALDVATMAQELGIGVVHIRTDLLRESVSLESLASCGVGVVSVDVIGGSRETYHRLTGVDRYEAVVDRAAGLLEIARSRAEAGLPSPWVVARITRCDEVYEELPDFYDRWLSGGAWVHIDPMPAAIPGARIGPLTVPDSALRRRSREHLLIRSDGRCVGPRGGALSGADLHKATVTEAWKAVQRARREALEPELETAA